MEAAWKFVRSGALVLGTIEDVELAHLHGLMSRYCDCPMDFADATLVYLAKRESLSVILTVDQSDFATYRIEGKRQFRVLPRKRPETRPASHLPHAKREVHCPRQSKSISSFWNDSLDWYGWKSFARYLGCERKGIEYSNALPWIPSRVALYTLRDL
jgi:hypothetical protein